MKKKKYVKRIQVSLTQDNFERLNNRLSIERLYSVGRCFKYLTYSELINMCIELVVK